MVAWGMVNTANAYDFAAVIDAFFAQKKLGGPHATLVTDIVRKRALELLAAPDVRYMPAFKILDMLGTLVNIGSAVAEASQLRAPEVRALLRESLSDGTGLIRQFMLDAALERARYEPMMVATTKQSAAETRNHMLERRWAAMRAAHQEWAMLPDSWMDTIDEAVIHALAAEDFRRFRQGPLLQLFAEMLAHARKLHQQGASTASLAEALSEHGTLWKRYALKTERFRERSTQAADIRTLQPQTHRIH